MLSPVSVSILQGEHFHFEEKDIAVGFVICGTVEIYAINKESKENIFLTCCTENEYFFSADDYANMIEFSVFAKTDAEIIAYTKKDIRELVLSKQDLPEKMQTWFKECSKLHWLHGVAANHESILIQWKHKDLLKNLQPGNLWSAFAFHQNILVLLIVNYFASQKKFFEERLKLRQIKKELLMDASIDALTNENTIHFWSEANVEKSTNNIIYIVQTAAKFLKIPSLSLKMPPVEKKLDEDAILKYLCDKAGIQIRKVSLKGEWYKKDSGVLFARRNGVLSAVVPQKPGSYLIFNQDNHNGEVLTDINIQEFDSEAYVCYCKLPARRLKIKNLLSFMAKQCWNADYKSIIVASIIAGLIPLLTPIITKNIFSDIIPTGNRQSLATITQVMMVAGFTTAAVSLVRSISVLRITNHIDMSTEAALWSRLLSMPASFFKKYQTGELIQRMSAIDNIKNIITNEFVSGIFNTLFSVWSIILMCYYSLRLTLFALLVWLIYLLVTSFIYRKVYIYQKNAIASANKTSGQVLQIFNGLQKFRIQGAEEQAFYLWAKCFGEEWKWNLKLRWQNNYSSIINSLQPLVLTFLIYYAVYYSSGSQSSVQQFNISYSDFIAFQAALTSFNTSLVAMVPLVTNFFSIKPQLENLRPILEAEPETSDDRIEAENLSGEIKLRHLTFAYSEDGPEIFRDLNLDIAPGESVAIVGKSGCGKSTLVRLLLGFEKPKQGIIYYDGLDLNELNLSSVRRQMGVVLQNGQLMPGDILTNITGATNMTIDDAWLAAQRVGLADDIKEMPMQMYTAISEGSGNISGGQRQRILLARSIVNNPRILLLDEATSALDNTTQAIVTKSLSEMHCTKIIVAHRLSTIKNVDRILVLDNGKIAESGTYEELMNDNGIFAQLAKRQLI